MSDDSSINNTQRAAINASLIAQNSVMNETNDRTELATLWKVHYSKQLKLHADLEMDQKVSNLLEKPDKIMVVLKVLWLN